MNNQKFSARSLTGFDYITHKSEHKTAYVNINKAIINLVQYTIYCYH